MANKPDRNCRCVPFALKPYDPQMRKNTCFYTDGQPQEIFERIGNYFKENN